MTAPQTYVNTVCESGHSSYALNNCDSQDQSKEPDRSSAKAGKRLIEKIYGELYPSLLRFLRARTRSVDEAKDVAQETFGKLLELDGLNDVKSLRGFIWKTAQNIVIDRQRQRANRSRLDALVLFEPMHQFPSPEYWLDARQRLDRLERAIDLLPATCRAVFVLRVLKEQTPAEVAHALGISERLVRQYVARGIEHCAELLDDSETASGIESP